MIGLGRSGSWSNGSIPFCVPWLWYRRKKYIETDVGDAEVSFRPEVEDMQGVVQEYDTDLSPVADSK